MRLANSACVISKPRIPRIRRPNASQSIEICFFLDFVLDIYLYIDKIALYRFIEFPRRPPTETKRCTSQIANAMSAQLSIVGNEEHMRSTQDNFARESRFAKLLYGDLSKSALNELKELLRRHKISVIGGDVKHLEGRWYITRSGLL